MFSKRHSNRFLKVLNHVYDLPCPINLNHFWSFGSLLGLCLVVQIFTGLLLALHYTPEVSMAFSSVIHIMRDVNDGWFWRSIHANGASFFFICIYLHIGRGIFYHSFQMVKTWLVGCVIYVLLMAIAFTGYVLPWGQMSYWGATVITNMFGVVPYVGNALVEWICGGYGVGDATLKRFYLFHMLSPFLMMMLVVLHIVFLHDTGSGNPLGIDSDAEAIPFHPYYTLKDLLAAIVMLGSLVVVCLYNPDFFLDPVNYTPADPFKTPLHIQPEWYFLFAYTILRSIPNKVGGVVVMVMSVLVLFFLPAYPKSLWRGVQFNPVAQVLFWCFISNFGVLTFVGTCPVEWPSDFVGLVATLNYFIFFIVYPFSWFFWEDVIWNKDEIMEKVKGDKLKYSVDSFYQVRVERFDDEYYKEM